MWFRLPRWKSKDQLLQEADRLFGQPPSPKEVAAYLDRELSQKFSRQFDRIKEATQEITRRAESGVIDEDSAKAAKGQLALHVASAFKMQKAEATLAYDEAMRHLELSAWPAARDALMRALEHSEAPPLVLALAFTEARMGEDLAAQRRYEIAIASYRRSGIATDLGVALCQAALHEQHRGSATGMHALLTEALQIFKTEKSKDKASLVRTLIKHA